MGLLIVLPSRRWPWLLHEARQAKPLVWSLAHPLSCHQLCSIYLLRATQISPSQITAHSPRALLPGHHRLTLSYSFTYFFLTWYPWDKSQPLRALLILLGEPMIGFQPEFSELTCYRLWPRNETSRWPLTSFPHLYSGTMCILSHGSHFNQNQDFP